MTVCKEFAEECEIQSDKEWVKRVCEKSVYDNSVWDNSVNEVCVRCVVKCVRCVIKCVMCGEVW